MSGLACLPPAERLPYTLHIDKGSSSLVDYDALPEIWPRAWYLDRDGYVVARRPLSRQQKLPQSIRLHRLVMGLDRVSVPPIDHINGNPRDNRRMNLRADVDGKNPQNRHDSPTRGVTRRRDGWYVRVHIDGQTHCVGVFDSKTDAVRAAAIYRAKHMPFSVEALDPTLRDAEMPPSRPDRRTNPERGVGFHKRSQKWRAYYMVDGKTVHIGLYDARSEAVAAAQAARAALASNDQDPHTGGMP